MADYSYANLVKCVVLLGCTLGLGTFSTMCGVEAGELICSRDKVGTFWGPPGKVVYLTKTVKGGHQVNKGMPCRGYGYQSSYSGGKYT